MNSDAAEWSIDVDGKRVVLAFGSGDGRVQWVLNRHEARVMRHQLHLAYLLAGRNRFTENADAVSAAWTEAVADATEESKDRARLEAIRSTVGVLTDAFPADEDEPTTSADPGGGGLSSGAGRELPEGWKIFPAVGGIHFEVPASAADGEFELSRPEAAAVGLVLLRLSAPQSLRERVVDSETASDRRSGRFRKLSPAEWAELHGRPETELFEAEPEDPEL